MIRKKKTISLQIVSKKSIGEKKREKLLVQLY